REPAREQGRPDAVSRLPTGGVGQADDGKPREAVGDVHLHGNGPTLDTEEGGGWDRGDHGYSLVM
ncbi:MAG TPA: hypothetical protein VF005_03220, partial [Acidimicrobiales bacterium]